MVDAESTAPTLEIHNLSVAYNKKPVLYGVDLAIQPGSIVGIIGPNGAGKSTLFRAIIGQLRPLSGWIKIFGQPYPKVCQRIGYIPQRESVDWDFPVNVLDVVLMGRYGKLRLLQRPRPEDYAAAYKAIQRVGLEAFTHRQIGKLSGGQQQRVFIARALVQESDLYLMDEPFAGVDAATESAILDVLQELKRQGKTLLVVHHDLATARSYFDQLVLLNSRLIAYGKTQDVFTPENLQKTYGGRLTILSEVLEAF
ncbi:MAG: metal ABC transporter ATP-binding protein [Methylacidiphilales bacterium]|nr:metal ABC transporter ATP-binding protein [Candidatus Methylacidiphilales bacterium]MDW8350173.1 metal ABC transporter ATP-binding protein [Verrucomicrobiae bacterium]